MAAWPAEGPEAAEASRVSSTRHISVHSFEELYQQHFDFVWKCARAFGTTPQETDDVVQDVFMVMQRRLGDLREETVLRSWIYGITRRVVSSHRRRRREQESRSPDHVDVDALKSSDDRSRTRRSTRCSLRCLPPMATSSSRAGAPRTRSG